MDNKILVKYLNNNSINYNQAIASIEHSLRANPTFTIVDILKQCVSKKYITEEQSKAMLEVYESPEDFKKIMEELPHRAVKFITQEFTKDKYLINHDPELTKNNVTYIHGELVDSTSCEANAGVVKQTVDELFKDLQKSSVARDGELIESIGISRQKLKKDISTLRVSIRKTHKQNSACDEEIVFWEDLLLKSKNGKHIDVEKELFRYEQIRQNQDKDLQSGRYLSKIKAIENFSLYSNEDSKLEPLKHRVSSTITTKDFLMKIPDQFNINLEPEDWLEIADRHKRLFHPQFDYIYEAIHLDENPNNSHYHALISGKNNVTGAFDIQEQILRNIEKNNIKNGKFPEHLIGVHWSDIKSNSDYELIGTLHQELAHSLINKYFIDIGKPEIKFSKTSPEESKARNVQYAEDSQKKTLKRKFSQVGQLSEKFEELSEQNQKLVNKNEELKSLFNGKVSTYKKSIGELRTKALDLESDNLQIVQKNKIISSENADLNKNNTLLTNNFNKLKNSNKELIKENKILNTKNNELIKVIKTNDIKLINLFQKAYDSFFKYVKSGYKPNELKDFYDSQKVVENDYSDAIADNFLKKPIDEAISMDKENSEKIKRDTKRKNRFKP